MERDSSRPILSAVFVDYDNIYLSLKRKNEDAAKRFAKDAASWVRKLETGALITPTNAPNSERPRRLVMNRCYGNPVPRRNQNDNSTDMNSFPFVRHHFLRSGFEIVDCPPLTAQLKNSSDIRMVMDIRDYLDHKTNFDEFIILSSDADFTPVLHRLRSHAKRTVIFANDHTAAPYTALSDGEVREADLIAMLMGQLEDDRPAVPALEDLGQLRKQIIGEIVKLVLNASAPQPLEALADHATRVLGHDKTIATNWAGVGSFRELLETNLPDTVRLTEQAPYFAYDVSRTLAGTTKPQAALPAAPSPEMPRQHKPESEPAPAPVQEPRERPEPALSRPAAAPQPAKPAREAGAAPSTDLLQQSIARIHEACQAPAISPPEYRALFNVLAQEISENQLQGVKTLENVVGRAKELGIDIDRDDVRFVLDVVSEADPWFENGASAKLFAGRFRNFVVARCRSQGLNLSADELDLIDAWFAGGAARSSGEATREAPAPQAPAKAANPPMTAAPAPQQRATAPATQNWWEEPQQRQAPAPTNAPTSTNMGAPIYGQPGPRPEAQMPASSPAMDGRSETSTLQADDYDDFPRIVRDRLRN